jgi:RNA polymerase sigma-70 factor, ECF subfamily
VTYTTGATGSVVQRNDATVRKSSLAFAAQQRNPRRAVKKIASNERGKSVEAPQEDFRENALEEMFVASRKRFLAIAYSVLRNREDAEDAVQQAFLSAHRHLRSFEGRSALRTWLTRIVLNASLMMKRKRKTFALRPLSENSDSHDENWTENIPDSQPDPEVIHAERETIQLIDEKLENLRPVLRQAFTMTYYEDLTGAEACAKLGISSGTFKGRLFHARRKLLNGTERSLLLPIRSAHASPSESWKPKALQSLQGLES